MSLAPGTLRVRHHGQAGVVVLPYPDRREWLPQVHQQLAEPQRLLCGRCGGDVSAFAVDVEAVGGRRPDHDTAAPFQQNSQPVLDRRVFLSDAKSASQHASRSPPPPRQRLMSSVPARYRSTCLAARQCPSSGECIKRDSTPAAEAMSGRVVMARYNRSPTTSAYRGPPLSRRSAPVEVSTKPGALGV